MDDGAEDFIHMQTHTRRHDAPPPRAPSHNPRAIVGSDGAAANRPRNSSI